MYESMRDWLAERLPEYEIAGGGFIDSPNFKDMKFVVLSANGGSQNSGVRRSRYRVILMGRRDKREDSVLIMKQASDLINQTIDEHRPPCKAAKIESISEVVGPGFTTENRAWCELHFEVLF